MVAQLPAGQVAATPTATDLAVQGAGFFIVSDASGNIYLTRNGSFVPDASGNLVNSAGYYLMGCQRPERRSPLAVNSLSGLQKVNVASAGDSAIRDHRRLADRQPALDRDDRRRPPTCPRPTPPARTTPRRPRSSPTTISAARTRSTSISPRPAPTPGRSTPSTPRRRRRRRLSLFSPARSRPRR